MNHRMSGVVIVKTLLGMVGRSINEVVPSVKREQEEKKRAWQKQEAYREDGRMPPLVAERHERGNNRQRQTLAEPFSSFIEQRLCFQVAK